MRIPTPKATTATTATTSRRFILAVCCLFFCDKRNGIDDDNFSSSSSSMIVGVHSFSPSLPPLLTPMRTQSSSSLLQVSSSNRRDDDNHDVSFFDDNDQVLLNERLLEIRRKVLEIEMSRPPTNTDLSPVETVQTILSSLYFPYDPLPDSGFRLLLHTATTKWKCEILKSIGCDPTTMSNVDNDVIVSALGSSIGRPHNKYAILISSDDTDDYDEHHDDEEYYVRYSDPLDFDDGTCWVECSLFDPTTQELLVMTGWDLRQRQEDGAWLVDSIHWQDFREEFMSENKIEYLVA